MREPLTKDDEVQIVAPGDAESIVAVGERFGLAGRLVTRRVYQAIKMSRTLMTVIPLAETSFLVLSTLGRRFPPLLHPSSRRDAK
jgi:hypothetical protein